ncbi:DNA-directed RNA polymerase III subunit-like protein [Hapsidospora chrysogenum ATCC 11550]|uniref:DNA-directed RNA polymerase III subunit RPC9 n=1 Tax=Hapsidospora chrysogenum (strain ATCC 11550 / CBS 779.69 / DSM 880 / IAM 14645 / JCM 23072 / IMI 49137) TaxID=857340 RepID=A0A086SZ16_HAPC1|nr:DNA-directed RNA polymerase III subunit-like protein [Hapsidospora chrysogenum ATCC 11550]
MKILESQSAVLTNFEVYEHLVDCKKRSKKTRQRLGPDNYESIVKGVKAWLETPPGPLSQKPITYTSSSIPTLFARLRPYDLSKGELSMILNLRPASVPALDTIIEDMGERFTEEQHEEIIAIIVEVLGRFEPAEEAEGEKGARENGGDVTMNEADQDGDGNAAS